MDVLSRLVDKSLVTVVLAHDGRRYGFLDSIREFALSELYDSSDAEPLRDRYVAYYDALADRAPSDLAGAKQQEFLQRLQEELDNLRAAMQFGQIDARHAVKSLEIACNLEQFWLIRGYFAEGRRWLQQTLSAASPHIPPSKRAAALSAIAKFACFSDDLASAESHEREALQLRQVDNDHEGIAESLHTLGGIAFEKGDLQLARRFWQDSLDGFRTIGNDGQVAKSLDNLGLVLTELQYFDEARERLDESFALYAARRDAYGMAWVLSHRAWLAENLQHYDKAIDLHTESLALRKQLEDRHGTALALHSLARCHIASGDVAAATDAEAQSIRIWNELGYKTWLGEAFENLAHVKAKAGELECAAILLGAAENLRTLTMKPLQQSSRKPHQEALATIRERLGDDRTRSLRDAGSRATFEDAVAIALGSPAP
jgi:tetratricopeptide (TPR) repeat protein